MTIRSHPSDCATGAGESFAYCITKNCGAGSCAEGCLRAAQADSTDCIAGGGTAEACIEEVEVSLGDCFGACPAQCGGAYEVGCADNEFCLFPPDSCDVSDNVGVCM